MLEAKRQVATGEDPRVVEFELHSGSAVGPRFRSEPCADDMIAQTVRRGITRSNRQSVPTITLSDLTIAYALRPTSNLSFFAELVVITDTISIFGAILIDTSVLTGPILIAVIVSGNELRALIFMKLILSQERCG
jgi:hypothetical protein